MDEQNDDLNETSHLFAPKKGITHKFICHETVLKYFIFFFKFYVALHTHMSFIFSTAFVFRSRKIGIHSIRIVRETIWVFGNKIRGKKNK